MSNIKALNRVMKDFCKYTDKQKVKEIIEQCSAYRGNKLKLVPQDKNAKRLLWTNNRVQIIFCYNEEDKFSYNKIFVDHVTCFDKLQRCPLQLPIPRTTEEIQELAELISFVSCDIGYMLSNFYEFKTIKKYQGYVIMDGCWAILKNIKKQKIHITFATFKPPKGGK